MNPYGNLDAVAPPQHDPRQEYKSPDSVMVRKKIERHKEWTMTEFLCINLKLRATDFINRPRLGANTREGTFIR
jgi:hypothetical protein